MGSSTGPTFTTYPSPDQHVDVVVCALVLSHIPDSAPVLAEFVRVLRPGGHLVISDARDLLDQEVERLRGIAGLGRKRVEETYTEPGELGPYTDFELGMLNGKLSALRWVLGSEWDFLDT